MYWLSVFVEHSSLSLNKPFTYLSKQPVSRGCRVKVPFGSQQLIGVVVECSAKEIEHEGTVREILEVVDEEPLFNEELFALANHISTLTVSSLMSVMKTMLPPSYKPSSSHAARAFDDWFVFASPKPDVKLTVKQQQLLEALELPALASAVRKKHSVSLVRALQEKGFLQIEKKPRGYDLIPHTEKAQPPVLSMGQIRALGQISTSSQQQILLHGVTGSGKTEIFFQLAKQALEQNQQVLFLVPEIGLTPMMIARVSARFDCPILIYHSRLSPSEKASQYDALKGMGPCIVIGTRSACFLPFSRLGLIIMDEEHDTSYKQDNQPKYHTRNVLRFRAAWHQCKLIMASATPCLESYARAYKGLYKLVEMPDRFVQKMPAIHLIDMKTERSYGGLSVSLIGRIEAALKENKQVILLLNRRGYIPTVKCTSCGEPVLCEECGIPLSYHKGEQALVCHICGSRYPLQHECPNCHSDKWSTLGLGTERLEEHLHELFPKARLVRMDADSTRTKNGHAQLLDAFEKEGDILLGTQMVSKGLDFERVTLVGILCADSSLDRADYRASELTYQMLEQASGRAGRGQFPGDVLIQTFNPNHYVMQRLLRHDYRGFFQREMAYRHMGQYPPYIYMATLLFHHADPMKAYQAAHQAREFFEKQGIQVLGPMEITMRNKIRRQRIILKETNHEKLTGSVWQYTDWHAHHNRSIKYEINMDPMVLEE